jgi:hypothetical protein
LRPASAPRSPSPAPQPASPSAQASQLQLRRQQPRVGGARRPQFDRQVGSVVGSVAPAEATRHHSPRIGARQTRRSSLQGYGKRQPHETRDCSPSERALSSRRGGPQMPPQGLPSGPMPRALTICAVPGCWHTRPCPIPEHRSRSGSTRRWRRLRQEVLRRDGFRCVECGAPAVEVDHIEAVILGGTDAVSNLRSLCQRCHTLRHGVRSGSR